MSLTPFALICLAIFALTHYFWIPRVEKKIKENRGLSAIPEHALYGGLSVVRAAALVAAITTFSIILIVSVLSWMGGSTPETIASAIETAKVWQSRLVGFGPVWGAIAIVLLMIGLVLHARRRSKIKVSSLFNRMYADEYQKVAQAYQENKLEELPSTPDMEKLEAELGKVIHVIEHVDQYEVPQGLTKEQFVQQLVEVGASIRQKIVALDIHRRIKLELKEEDVAFPKPIGFWEKLQTAFFSKGLVNNLNRSTRLIYFLCLILLTPSLMGVYSGPVTGALDNRIVQLQNLQIDLEGAQSEQELQQEIEALGSAAHELSEEDLEVIDRTAEIYEESIAEALLASTNIAAASRYSMRSALVRDRILINFSRKAHTGLEKLPSGSQAPSLRTVESEALQVAENALNGQKTRIDRKDIVRTELKKAAERRPGLINRLRTEVSSFQTPAKASDISRSLARHTVGTALGGAGQGELGMAVQQAMEGRSAARLNMVTEINSRQFVKNIIAGDGIEMACGKAATSVHVEQLKPMMRSVVDNVQLGEIPNKLNNYPPSVKSTPEPHVKVNNATDKIVNMSRSAASGGGGNLAYADALAEFGDWFPEQLDADSRTARGRAMNEISGNRASMARSSSASRSFARSRSFVRLRGFSRVGGVLIGVEEPKNEAEAASFIDIDWQIEGRYIRLLLTDQNGRVHRSRPHALPIAYQALNYAADGRPLAVTMVTAPPLQELKILCHPTLIDTPLGYRMIELDRFVDKYTGEDSRRRAATEKVYEIHALYQLAWAIRAQFFLEKYMEQNPGAIGQLMEISIYVDQMSADPERRAQAQRALRDPSLIADPDHSPMVVKTEFYEADLVDAVLAAARSSRSVEAFEVAIGKSFFDKKVREEWISVTVPEFQVWSGVRENNFAITPSDLILGEDNRSTPLHFMLQVAFTTPPIDSDSEEAHSDTQPWEFPALGNHIEEQVIGRLNVPGDDRVIFNDAVDFTYLQRLFRMAFGNYLGENFPIEKLIDLAEDLDEATSVKKYRTLRWNAFPGYEAQLYSIMTEDNREQILELIELRRDLGVVYDAEQILENGNRELPSLF